MPHQRASANSSRDQAEPPSRPDEPRSPPKASRTPSTMCLIGKKSLAYSSHTGPIVIGSRIPESSSTGIITESMR